MPTHDKPETCTWCESAPTYTWGYDEHNGTWSLCIDCHKDKVEADSSLHETIAELLPAIADEYASAPILASYGFPSEIWGRLADWATVQAANIGRVITVTTTDNPEPYATSDEQSADIRAGRFLVSRAHCEHPVWTVEQNVAFRVWHDVMGHHAHGCGFDRHGEIAAYLLSLPTVPAGLWPALFVESIGQLAYAVAAGDFGPQKVYLSSIYHEVHN